MKALILDLGNVVVRWDPHALYRPLLGSAAAVDDFLAEVGFAAWNLEQDRGRDWDLAVAELSGAFPHRAELIAAYRDRLIEAHPGLVPGMAALIEALAAAGVPLYALSNASARTGRLLAEAFPELMGAFRDVVLSAELGLLKPDAAIYRACLARIGWPAGDVTFVDDNAGNVAGAAAAGIDAIRFTGAGALRTALAARDFPVGQPPAETA